MPKPGVESDYTKRFKAWKFDAMGIHEEYEYYMEKKASVAPIPDNYMDSNVLTCPTRESSLYVENARIRDVSKCSFISLLLTSQIILDDAGYRRSRESERCIGTYNGLQSNIR